MDEYNIIKFCMEFAYKNAFQPATKEQIELAMVWLDRVAALDYEMQAKQDNVTDVELI